MRTVHIDLKGFSTTNLEELRSSLETALAYALGQKTELTLTADNNPESNEEVFVQGIDSEDAASQEACRLLEKVFPNAEIHFTDSCTVRLPKHP